MLTFTVWPVYLGIMATLRVITGVTKTDMLDADDGDEEGGGSGSVAGLSKSMHSDIEKSTKDVHSYVQKVEAQINDLQRGHDTRFADLHKDLAGIVWELSKLRADMARWQALAQLGVRSKSQSAVGGDGKGGGGATGEAPGGARAWRGEGP